MAEKYIIRVTAGSGYDLDSHVEVPVNAHQPVKITNQFVDVELNVRIRKYGGLPRGSPATSPYFSQEPHAWNNDQYSIAFRFTPRKPAAAESDSAENDDDAENSDEEGEEEEQEQGISAHDLQFGNDFDHPIRDRLPPGFGTAMNIVKWWIDPGLEGDPYADSPYLYGSALSSFNAVHVGPGEVDEEKGGLWFEEGGDEDGMRARRAVGAPDDSKGRMKWALKPDSKLKWLWEYGRTYAVDFFNPYLDFSEFALRLPGFQVPIMKYWDGQGLRAKRKRSHQLRYVLRNRSTGDVYLVVLFTLYRKEDVNEDGSLKPAAIASTQREPLEEAAEEDSAVASEGLSKDGEDVDEAEVLEEARRKLSGADIGSGRAGGAPGDTNDDDID